MVSKFEGILLVLTEKEDCTEVRGIEEDEDTHSQQTISKALLEARDIVGLIDDTVGVNTRTVGSTEDIVIDNSGVWVGASLFVVVSK